MSGRPRKGRAFMEDYVFEDMLVEGTICSRPNRFIMMVERNGRVHKCHCPATGRIGDIVFKDVPCLLSKGVGKRRTKFTVEAISLDPVDVTPRSWIGINQNRANRFIEFLIWTGQLPKMMTFAKGDKVLREQPLARSRIDLMVRNTFIEVKTPLITLPRAPHLEYKEHGEFDSFDRLVRHFNDLGRSLKDGSRAIVVLCYLYDAEPFEPPAPDRNNQKVRDAVARATKRGVENWQVNLRIDERSVSLVRYFKLEIS